MNEEKRNPYVNSKDCSHKWDITFDGKYFKCVCCNKKVKK